MTFSVLHCTQLVALRGVIEERMNIHKPCHEMERWTVVIARRGWGGTETSHKEVK